MCFPCLFNYAFSLCFCNNAPLFAFTEQLHQDVQVQLADVPALEPVRAVPAAGQLLLPVPAGSADDPGHLLSDTHHHGRAAAHGPGADGRQGRLRRLPAPRQRLASQQPPFQGAARGPPRGGALGSGAGGRRHPHGERPVCCC